MFLRVLLCLQLSAQSEDLIMEMVESYWKFWGTCDHTGILVRLLIIVSMVKLRSIINKKQDFSCQEKNVGSYILLEDKINLLLFSTHYLTPTVFQYQINLWCSYLFTSIVLPSSPCPYFQKTWLGFHESIVLITFLYPLWLLLPWIPFS